MRPRAGEAVAMSTVEENMRLMQTLDDARITTDWGTFDNRYADDIEVLWPGQGGPTHSRPTAR